MRDIEFRARDKFDGMLYTTEDLIIIPSMFNHLDFSYDHYGRITFYKSKDKSWQKHLTGHSGILMQYIGREDKNKKKIFEKDILLGRFNLDDIEDHIFLQLSEEEKRTQSKIFVVEDIFYLYTNQVPDDLEIIGNVFENSNLLDNNS